MDHLTCNDFVSEITFTESESVGDDDDVSPERERKKEKISCRSCTLSLSSIYLVRRQTFRRRFPEVFFEGKKTRMSKGARRERKREREKKKKRERGRAERVGKLYFRSVGSVSGPDARARNGRLKEVLLRDKPEVIRLPRGKLSFLPAGFFAGLRPPTNIHSRLTPLFTVCGCLSGFLPLIGIFYVVLFAVALFFRCLQ